MLTKMTSQEITEMLKYRCDTIGECDTCHKDHVRLWRDESWDGSFEDCVECWVGIRDNKRREEEKARRAKKV